MLKFHEPGLAPVLDSSGAYHVDRAENAAYPERFIRTFGFYDLRAAVQAPDGWYHIHPDGSPLYARRYAWCGNFQQKYATVKTFNHKFFHINQDGQPAYSQTYNYAGDFRDGIATVQEKDGLYTHIDFQGNLLHGKKFHDLDVYHKGYARARNQDGWFHIDMQGQEAYPQRYKNIEPFYNGVSRVETDAEALLLINEHGTLISTLRQPLQDPFHQVSGELVSYWRFYTLDAACSLNIFDHLPATTLDISKKTSLPLDSAEKLLTALAEMGFVERSIHWELTKKGTYLTSDHPFSLISAQKLWKEEHLASWQNLLYSLQTGKPSFDHLFGMPWFDYLQTNNEKNHLYHSAISTYARRDYHTITSRLDFSEHHTILDIGGSTGSLLFEILTKNPHLQGLLLDLPSVTQLVHIPPHLQHRLQLIPADFFHTFPSITADCALLSRVLHDWSDAQCIELLKKIPTPHLYIIENITHGALLNLNMLVMTEGRERSLQDFQNLLHTSGFTLETTLPLNEVSTLLIARKT